MSADPAAWCGRYCRSASADTSVGGCAAQQLGRRVGPAAGVGAVRVDRSAAMTVRSIGARKAGFSGLVSARPLVAHVVVPVHHRDASPPGSFSQAVRGGAGKRRTSPHRQGHRPRFGFGVDHPKYMSGPATVGSEPRRAPVNGREFCPVVATVSARRVGVGLSDLHQVFDHRFGARRGHHSTNPRPLSRTSAVWRGTFHRSTLPLRRPNNGVRMRRRDERSARS